MNFARIKEFILMLHKYNKIVAYFADVILSYDFMLYHRC